MITKHFQTIRLLLTL